MTVLKKKINYVEELQMFKNTCKNEKIVAKLI